MRKNGMKELFWQHQNPSAALFFPYATALKFATT